MRRARGLAALLLLAASCASLPAAVVGVEEVTPEELARRLRDPRPPLLLDTRDAESYRRGHVPGALSVRVDQVAGLLHTTPLQGDREVVAVCYFGNGSLGVAASIQARWSGRARSLHGGMRRWTELGLPLERGEGPRLEPERLRPPLVRASPAARAAFVAARHVLAPIALGAGALLLLWLRRGRDPSIALVRRGLIALLCGVAAGIAADLQGPAVELDLGEGLCAAAAAALLGLGLFRLLDGHVLHLAERAPLAARRLFLGLGPALALLALVPWTTPIRRLDLRIDLPGGGLHVFRTVEVQVVELRLYPLLAAALLLIATATLLREERPLERARAPFFAGLGFLLAGTARAALLALFESLPVWARVWKVSADLLSVLLLALGLHLFRAPLGLIRPASSGGGVDASRDRSL
jgi:rhodanese-related sulfurtransferase